MGPPQAEKALREALAMGADEAILVSDQCICRSRYFSYITCTRSNFKEIRLRCNFCWKTGN